MRRVVVPVLVLAAVLACGQVWAVSSNDLLKRVKSAEAGFRDFSADLVITNASKKNVADMGERLDEILLLQKASIRFITPDKLRYDGVAKGIKATYIQNGYYKLVLAAMIRQKTDVKEAPGKRQDTLDLGFLSSNLWKDNYVKVLGMDKGLLKLNFDPKFGGNDKRHDLVWIDPTNLRVIKRQKYLGGGALRVRTEYSDFVNLTKGLPMAGQSTLYDPDGDKLGTIAYANLKIDAGVPASLFSLTQK
jgi:outer membrane lipoprotein-sorting protein